MSVEEESSAIVFCHRVCNYHFRVLLYLQIIKKEVQDRMKFSGAFRSSKAAQGAEWVRGWNDESKKSTID